MCFHWSAGVLWPAVCQSCYNAIQKDAEENEAEKRRKMNRRSKKQPSDLKLSAETRMVLAGLFVVLGFIYGHNFKFIDDYR